MSNNVNQERRIPNAHALLVLPRIHVQNANAISSPLTWGFPAISAFLGMMTALERRLGQDSGITFRAIGVICHHFEAQVTTNGYTRAFHLTRNPVDKAGGTEAIVEEGRVHLVVTLVFHVLITSDHLGEEQRQTLADLVNHEVAGMRVAGGSVMPPPLSEMQRQPGPPTLVLLADDPDQQRQQFRRLARRWLPGFSLVSRDDLMQSHLAKMQDTDSGATSLDAWLDLSRWNHRAVQTRDIQDELLTTWVTDSRPGWTVPIPVGYAGLSELHAPGTVISARDSDTPFRFVEPIWSMGQWVSPHRLKGLDDFLWYAQVEGNDNDKNIYCCKNDYTPPSPDDLINT